MSPECSKSFDDLDWYTVRYYKWVHKSIEVFDRVWCRVSFYDWFICRCVQLPLVSERVWRVFCHAAKPTTSRPRNYQYVITMNRVGNVIC
jgi:hypothetical protein